MDGAIRTLSVPLSEIPHQFDARDVPIPSYAHFAIPIIHYGDPQRSMTMFNMPWELAVGGLIFQGVVPRFMSTDFASIPSVLAAIRERDGRHLWAALIHDDLYSTERFERHLCDEIYSAALRYSGVGNFESELHFKAVRAAGQPMWDGHTRQSIDQSRALHQYAGAENLWCRM